MANCLFIYNLHNAKNNSRRIIWLRKRQIARRKILLRRRFQAGYDDAYDCD